MPSGRVPAPGVTGAVDAISVRGDPVERETTGGELRLTDVALGDLRAGEEGELKKYKSAMEYGANKGQLRGLEIVTKDQSTVPYWDAMMAAQGVKGNARYAP